MTIRMDACGELEQTCSGCGGPKRSEEGCVPALCDACRLAGMRMCQMCGKLTKQLYCVDCQKPPTDPDQTLWNDWPKGST